MLIYRYERPDGGGPFFTRDGRIRLNTEHMGPIIGGEYLSGCLSKELLDKYWSQQKDNEYYLAGCILKIYEVPDDEVIDSAEHVYFPNRYQPIN